MSVVNFTLVDARPDMLESIDYLTRNYDIKIYDDFIKLLK